MCKIPQIDPSPSQIPQAPKTLSPSGVPAQSAHKQKMKN